MLKWDTVIEQKAIELGRYLDGKSGRLDFTKPAPTLHSTDDRRLRERILSLSGSKARNLGIGKSTLHYLRRNAKAEGSFKIYCKVHARLT